MERKAELLSTNKQAALDKKALKSKAETKAGQLTGVAAAATAALLGDNSTTIFGDFTENFDKEAYEAEQQVAAIAEAKAKADKKAAEAQAKAERKVEEKAKDVAKADAKVASYDKATGEQLAKMEKKAELISTNKQAVADKKALKAKSETKAGQMTGAAAAATAALLGDTTTTIYDDFTENFDKEAYEAEQQVAAIAEAKAKADKKAAEAQAKADKKDAEAQAKAERKAEEKIKDVAKADAKVASYDKATGEQLAKMEKKAELISTNKQAVADKKALKAKSETKAGQMTGAAAAATAALLGDNDNTKTTIFDDFTENFDKEAYEAEQQVAAIEEAKAKADNKAAEAKAKAEKQAERQTEAVAKADAKLANYDKATGEQLEKMERKAELLSTNKQAALDKKALKSKAETKAGQLTGVAAAATAELIGDTSTTIFGDFTENFDKAAYEAEQQAAAIEEAKAKADNKAAEAKAKAEKQAERQTEAVAKADAKLANYDKATGEQLEKMERKAELLSTNKQAVAENKALKVVAKSESKAEKALVKAERQAAKVAEASILPPTVLFSDYIGSFDKASYDAERKAIAEAESKAKAEAKALKFERKAASEAKVEAEIAAAYDKAAGKQLAKMERESELVSTNSQAAADKTAKATAKAEAKAELVAPKLASAASTIPTVSLFGDYTETFDKAAYEADKKAAVETEAKAKADAKAEAETAKTERKLASEAKAEAKITTAYDKATGEQIAQMEKESDLVSANKQGIVDRKAVKDNARNEKRAIRFAKKPESAPVASFDDFTEQFNKAEYEAEQVATAESIAAKRNADAVTKQRDRVVAKNQKDIKATEMLETKLADGEMLVFAKTYRADVKKNKKRLERDEKLGKFMLEYGSTYDPEWDGEFNNYGLPENDPLTEGVKLSTSRRRTPKREKLSAFNAAKLTALARMQRDTDNKMIVARVQSEFADLELEVAKAKQDFAGDFRNGKEKRWLRHSKKKLGSLRTKIALAEKYEKLDNDRYYSVVTTNFETVTLPSRADRDELIAMREELMRLLDIRDEINAELIQLYTGTEKGNGVNHIKRRNKVVLKARKRAHAKYRKHYNALNKYHATRNEKMRVFDKLDEVVELSGELARIKYILKKEKPIGKGRREYIREKGNAKSNLRYAKRYADRFTAKAVRKAKMRQRRTRALIASLVLLALLGAGALALYLLAPHLLEMAKPMLPEKFHQYIDMIKGAWPKK